MNIRKLTIALIGLALTIPVLLQAQTGFHIASFFDGRFNKNPQVVTIRVKGKPLKNYNLTLYHSMTFENSMEKILSDIEHSVELDGKTTVDKETGYMKGHLLYGFYCFRSNTKNNNAPLRYIIYKRNEKKTFLIYIEGYATIDKLKSMFKN